MGWAGGRRLFSLNYGLEPTTDEHVAHLQRMYQHHIQGPMHTKEGWLHEEGFLNSDRPRIQRMLAKPLELGLR